MTEQIAEKFGSAATAGVVTGNTRAPMSDVTHTLVTERDYHHADECLAPDEDAISRVLTIHDYVESGRRAGI